MILSTITSTQIIAVSTLWKRPFLQPTIKLKEAVLTLMNLEIMVIIYQIEKLIGFKTIKESGDNFIHRGYLVKSQYQIYHPKLAKYHMYPFRIQNQFTCNYIIFSQN